MNNAEIKNKLHLAQAELDKILDIHQKTISRYESGKRDLTLKKMEKYKQTLMQYFCVETIVPLFNTLTILLDENNSYNLHKEDIINYFPFNASEKERLSIFKLQNMKSYVVDIKEGDIIVGLSNPTLVMQGTYIFTIKIKDKQETYISKLSRVKSDIILVKDYPDMIEVKEADIILHYEIKRVIKLIS